MARTMSVAENHHLLWSSSHTARTSRSLKNRIDFLLIYSNNLFPMQYDCKFSTFPFNIVWEKENCYIKQAKSMAASSLEAEWLLPRSRLKLAKPSPMTWFVTYSRSSSSCAQSSSSLQLSFTLEALFNAPANTNANITATIIHMVLKILFVVFNL